MNVQVRNSDKELGLGLTWIEESHGCIYVIDSRFICVYLLARFGG